MCLLCVCWLANRGLSVTFQQLLPLNNKRWQSFSTGRKVSPLPFGSPVLHTAEPSAETLQSFAAISVFAWCFQKYLWGMFAHRTENVFQKQRVYRILMVFRPRLAVSINKEEIIVALIVSFLDSLESMHTLKTCKFCSGWRREGDGGYQGAGQY